MKIRCGSHQQNRSIVRPGLSLMATKVALTAEEFRENSQRSIALFNTEKLSTDSTHVLKSAYCNSVHFCRCNLHGACGGKGNLSAPVAVRWLLQSARSVWRQRSKASHLGKRRLVAICTERVEAKDTTLAKIGLYARCNLHGACGGKDASLQFVDSVPQVAICTERVEAKLSHNGKIISRAGCNLHGACGGKGYENSTFGDR